MRIRTLSCLEDGPIQGNTGRFGDEAMQWLAKVECAGSVMTDFELSGPRWKVLDNRLAKALTDALSNRSALKTSIAWGGEKMMDPHTRNLRGREILWLIHKHYNPEYGGPQDKFCYEMLDNLRYDGDSCMRHFMIKCERSTQLHKFSDHGISDKHLPDNFRRCVLHSIAIRCDLEDHDRFPGDKRDCTKRCTTTC